jgi:hypothetical protein
MFSNQAVENWRGAGKEKKNKWRVAPRAFACSQQLVQANRPFQHKKTNNSVKTGPSEAKPRLQAAVWVELMKWVSLGWVWASLHSLGGSQT